MVGKYKEITLCGSTKFKEQYLEAQKRLTLEGNIVISVGLFDIRCEVMRDARYCEAGGILKAF